MKQMITRAFIAIAAIAVGVVIASPAASASPSGDAWQLRASAAMTKFKTLDTGTEGVMAYAYMAEASGRTNGWSHADTTAYLAKVYAMQNASGGWGLTYAYDAFNDGSVNPADTTYTVTMADHVGLPLLEGFNAGVVPQSYIQGLVNKLMAMPRVPVTTGTCIAYSNQSSDAANPNYCVHNVNAGAAYFLNKASAAGVTATGLSDLVKNITLHEASTYNTTTKQWPYLGLTGPNQDFDHGGYSAQAMYSLRKIAQLLPTTYRTTGMHAGEDSSELLMMTNNTETLAPLAHMRLTSNIGGISRWNETTQAYDLITWCALGAAWTAQADAFIANPPGKQTDRLSQAAVYSARNAMVC